MNSTAFSDPEIGDSLNPEPQSAGLGAPPYGLPGHVTRNLVTGTSALGLGVVLERGMGFTANVLAARFGGVATFGAYSLAISTANNISTYAAGQIGSTAARFSGKYQYGTSGYRTLAGALVIVSGLSALMGAVGLWFAADPIAHLLGKQSLTELLRWAAISAAGIILLECARGFFVGQRRLAALILLSTLVGLGLITLLPFAAFLHSPIRMIVSQGIVTTGAVITCLLLARPLGLLPPRTESVPVPLRPVLREVWSFGFVQLAGLVGANLAGWWLTTLVARADSSLIQMSFFAVASQLRNIAGLAPGLLTESSYAVMADPDGETTRTPHNVMALCTYAATFASLMLATVGMVIMPWALSVIWGRSYGAGAVTASIGLAIAVMHMGNAPAAARLSIVSIRITGILNTIWALVVAVAATVFLLHGGTAATGMLIYFFAHLLSAGLVLITLTRKDTVPSGMLSVLSISACTTTTLVALAYYRASHSTFAPVTTLGMIVVSAFALFTLYLLGKRHQWLPTSAAVRRGVHLVRSGVQRLLKPRSLTPA